MEKIKRFIECLIPVTACNLKCSYCYIIQRNNRKGEMANLAYTPQQIGAALNKERWGGTCYFSICGAGETTLQKDIENIVYEILKQGHYVNITTNGTITGKLQKIIEKSLPFIKRLHFSFSFHYLELERLNLTQTFFDNIKIVHNAGASYVVQFNMCDEYIPHLERIKELCIKNTGAMPQIAATRKEEKNLEKIQLLTSYSEEEYKKLGEEFKSQLFDFTMKNFNVKRREFCYAGDWSVVLNLSTGIMKRCYCSCIYQNIFEDPSKKLRFWAVGKHCGSPFCMNSSHFMSLGVIPDIKTPTYLELRNRSEASWYTDEMQEFLSSKLEESNCQYSRRQKKISDFLGILDENVRRVYKMCKK